MDFSISMQLNPFLSKGAGYLKNGSQGEWVAYRFLILSNYRSSVVGVDSSKGKLNMAASIECERLGITSPLRN